MAKFTGLLRKQVGSIGDLTFKQVNGMTIVSEKITQMTNPRSDGQMRVRTRWNNIVAMYKGIRPKLKKGFESKPAGLSDFNMFMKMNMQKEPVYLTKQAVAGGACIAAPYQITQGSLPAIVITGTGNAAVTDIHLGVVSLSATTTIAQFAKAVVDHNPDYQYGDQISFFKVEQKTNAETGIPYCQFSAWKVVLDAADTETKLWDVVAREGFSTSDGCLAHSNANFVGAFGWVHSRKSNGKTLVSSQSLISANDTLLAQYQGDLAYNLARSSYGMGEDVYLTPNGEVSGETSGGGDNNGGGGNGGGGNDTL
ncbi:hypothetical protein [Ruminobacter sp.]|uniref:hypothetical protein n=1 Tax=Ruminobacter sp. TaxID=2774296 RepID=UPI00386D85DD